jgi:hypothetical protein
MLDELIAAIERSLCVKVTELKEKRLRKFLCLNIWTSLPIDPAGYG